MSAGSKGVTLGESWLWCSKPYYYQTTCDDVSISFLAGEGGWGLGWMPVGSKKAMEAGIFGRFDEMSALDQLFIFDDGKAFT